MADLPCDADGMCMVCKIVPPDTDVLMCGSCVSPWHMRCLNPPMESVPLGDWDCPDCSPPPVDEKPPAAVVPAVESNLMSKIRAIQADVSLTEDEKAKRRQELMSKGLHDDAAFANGDTTKSAADGKKRNATLEMMDQSLNCIFCMQLAERPVTVRPSFRLLMESWFYPLNRWLCMRAIKYVPEKCSVNCDCRHLVDTTFA